MDNLEELREAAETAAAREREAKTALLEATNARREAIQVFNLALMAGIKVEPGRTIVTCSGRFAWRSAKEMRAVLTPCDMRLGYARGREVNKSGKIWRGRSEFTVPLDSVSPTHEVLKE